MVKLSVSTEVSKDKVAPKDHLDDTYEVPLEKQAVVHLTRPKPRCTRYKVGMVIAILIIASVGGALLGVFLYKRHDSPRCIDWGPGCEMNEPPAFSEHHDHLNHGGDNGNEGVKVEFHLGFGDGDGSDKTNQQDLDLPHKADDPYRKADDPHRPGARPHDRDRYHPRPGHRLPPKNRPYPPGPAGPQGKDRHHGQGRHHHPIP